VPQDISHQDKVKFKTQRISCLISGKWFWSPWDWTKQEDTANTTNSAQQ